MTPHALNPASTAVAVRPVPDGPPPGPPVDPVLLRRVLQPYSGKGCDYLKAMTAGPVDGSVRGAGEFAIAQSCYIDDTGHLNAAEVIICYNQLLYALLAVSIRERLVPALADRTEQDYWARQLDGVLITRQSASFVRPVSPRAFRGEISFGQALTGRPDRTLGGRSTVTLQTRFRFADDTGGSCHGEVRVVVLP